jgi:hypothetical protein
VELWKLSAASTLVLRDGGKAEARDVLKLAIKELVLDGAWKLAKAERPRRLRGPKAVTLLIPGDRPPPGRVPLGLAHTLVESGHVGDWGGVQGREIRAMAKHIAVTRPRLRTELIQRVGLDLAEQGLVDWNERRVLGVVRRPKMVRTEAGERALEEYRRHEAALSALPASKDEADAAVASAAGLALLSPRTSGGDAFGGGGFGEVFDGGFDNAFDSSFDSAFDSGFSDGGGDGGGGDGGGGGGD